MTLNFSLYIGFPDVPAIPVILWQTTPQEHEVGQYFSH